eukprot:15426255-Alexandrium_andersonii.AAC.1
MERPRGLQPPKRENHQRDSIPILAFKVNPASRQHSGVAYSCSSVAMFKGRAGSNASANLNGHPT